MSGIHGAGLAAGWNDGSVRYGFSGVSARRQWEWRWAGEGGDATALLCAAPRFGPRSRRLWAQSRVIITLRNLYIQYRDDRDGNGKWACRESARVLRHRCVCILMSNRLIVRTADITLQFALL